MYSLKNLVRKTAEDTIATLKLGKREVEKGLELHEKSIVFDSLTFEPAPFSNDMSKRVNEMLDAGMPLRLITEEITKIEDTEFIRNTDMREEYMYAWKVSGVTCINQTVANHFTCSLQDAFKRLSHSKLKLDIFSDLLLKAACADDIRKAKKEGKHAVMWNSQNTHGLAGGVNAEEDLDKINIFYALGFRAMQLTYNLRNVVGDGCLERYKSGLSRFGIRVVERMNELGMLVDVSHCGYQTTLDAVEISREPVAATHTSCRAIYDHPRGKTDEELKAIAEKGGYIGIYMVPSFVGGKATIKEFLDHIDYAVELVGVDHIGIGTDTGYRGRRPQRLVELMSKEREWWTGFKPEHFSLPQEAKKEDLMGVLPYAGSLSWINWPYYTVGLVSRGYSDFEIQKIIGSNFLSIIEKVVG